MTDFTLQFKGTADGKLAVKGLKEVEEAVKATTKGTTAGFEQATKSIGAAAAATVPLPPQLRAIGTAVASVVSISAGLNLAKKLIETADNSVLAAARIRMVANSLEQQVKVTEQLYRISTQLQVPAAEMINSFPRIARAVKELGGSTQDATDLLKIHAITVRASGATQTEAASSALQFAQALQSGRLQGDEFRAINEANGELIAALARGLGVATGELRRMSEAGELTSEKVMKALLSQFTEMEKKASSIPRTVAGAQQAWRDEFERNIATDKRVIESQRELAETIDRTVAGMRKMREERDRMEGAEVPQEVRNQGTLAVAKWNRRQREGLNGAPPTFGFTGFQSGSDEDSGETERSRFEALMARQASMARQFRDAVADVETASTVNDKYNKSLTELSIKFAEVGGYAGASTEQIRRFEETSASMALKRTQQLESLATIGKASYSAVVQASERRLQLESAAFDKEAMLFEDATRRELQALEVKHHLGLMSEEQYIDQVADKKATAAQVNLAAIRRQIAVEEGVLATARAAPARTESEREAKKAKVLETEKKIVELTGKEQIGLREVNQSETERVALQERLKIATEERIRNWKRETEDRRRSLQDEVDQLQLQLDLIGLTEKAQQRLIIEEKARAEVVKETLAAERDIAELKRKNADPAEIAARQNARDQRIADINASAEVKKGLADKIIDKQVQDRIAQRVAEALMNARSLKDAAKSIGRILEDELKNQIITVYLKPALKEGVDALFKFAQTGDFGSMSPQAQAGLTMMLGGFAGGGGARALGAGQRGQQVGAITGAAGAQLGMMVGGPVGAVIGALAGAVIGKFTDPNGLANRTAIVGKNPGDPGGFRWNSRFGDAGIFNSHWFNAEQHEGLSQFTAMMARLENSIAQRLKPDEIARISNTINAPKQYSFGIEHSDQSDELLGILRDRLAIIVEGVLPGLGKLVSEFQGSGEEMANFVDSLLRLRDMTSDFDRLIAQVTDNAADLVRSQIEQLKSAVDTAQQAFDTARANKDATAMIAAEENLTNAIIEHYQVRVNMARQLQQNLRDIDEQSYNFSLQMAQRINALGGSINIGSLAGGRAAALYGQLGTGDVASRLKGLQGYVGARETEYNARREEILRNAQAQIDAQAAIANWQSQANQTMIAALQQELALAQQFSGVVDKTRGIMESFKYGPTNPLHALGRLGLANDDLEGLKAAYNGATGANRAGAANRYAEALQRRMGMVNEADIQRPSGEYLTYFNATMEELTRVQADAQAEADRQAALQDRIASLSELSNGYQATTADATTVAADYLNALDAEFRSYYEDANAIGERLYDEQRRAAKEALDAATGGVEVDLFIAQMQKESRDKLTEMVELMKAFLAAGGTVVPTGGTGTTTTGGTGTPIGTGGGGGGGGGSGGVETLLPVAVQIGDTNFANLVLRTVVSNGRVVRQTVEQS